MKWIEKLLGIKETSAKCFSVVLVLEAKDRNGEKFYRESKPVYIPRVFSDMKWNIELRRVEIKK